MLRTPKLRFVTAASLFDGHDASINIVRRLLMRHGCDRLMAAFLHFAETLFPPNTASAYSTRPHSIEAIALHQNPLAAARCW